MAGQAVELHDDTFLRISSIWRESDGHVSLAGRRLFKRCSLKEQNHEYAYIPRGLIWRNELVWVENEISDVPLDLVKKFVPLHFTNYCHVSTDIKKAKHGTDLFCRLKKILRPTGENSVEYLSYEEADVEYRVKPRVLRQSWRGEIQQAPVIVLDNIEVEFDRALSRKGGRKYTFGDGFCGAGGVSCGAEIAGLQPTWAFDSSCHAADTYRLNFPDVECWTSDIFNFLTNDESYLRVDVTHGSPPCQTFSPAHTIESPNDDANSACIFSCGNLIRKARPRVHTMEETSGLFERHKKTFYGVIRDFLEAGYSVRWTVLNCMEFGVPQSRKRLKYVIQTRRNAASNAKANARNTWVWPPGTPDHDIEGARARARSSQKQRAPIIHLEPDALQIANSHVCRHSR
ncbi:S-adenosyl-L-methionine-dependent methyltransferase [Aspergillus heterothallicus]